MIIRLRALKRWKETEGKKVEDNRKKNFYRDVIAYVK